MDKDSLKELHDTVSAANAKANNASGTVKSCWNFETLNPRNVANYQASLRKYRASVYRGHMDEYSDKEMTEIRYASVKIGPEVVKRLYEEVVVCPFVER
jgi:hypothetical protein